MTTGERIGILAKEKGINLHKLSVMIGISYDTLYSIVKRKSKKVDAKIIDRIAEVLKVGYRFEDDEIIFYEFRDTIDLPVTNNSNSNKLNLQLFSTDDVTVNSNKVMEQFNKLNEKGQQKALEQIELLTKIQEYLK